jgi:hypothetical protein
MQTSRIAPTPSEQPPSLAQTMILQGVIPIVLVGIFLPLGLTAFMLALEKAPIGDALEHGELFLAAGNTAFTGCIVLVTSRTDRALNATIAALAIHIAIILPAYACWAFLTVHALLDMDYSKELALVGGGIYAGLGAIVALILVRISYRSE